MTCWKCRQHGDSCLSYAKGGAESLNKKGVTDKNYKEKCDKEEQVFIEACLEWVV
jgi:hypothetical protein